MNAEIIVSALLNLSNAFEKSVKKLNAVVSMIFKGMLLRYKLWGSREGLYPLKVPRDSIQSDNFPLSTSR